MTRKRPNWQGRRGSAILPIYSSVRFTARSTHRASDRPAPEWHWQLLTLWRPPYPARWALRKSP